MTRQEIMLAEIKAAMDKAMDPADAQARVGLALNAMAFAAGIAAAVMENAGRGRVTAAGLLSAVLQSEIVAQGIENLPGRGRAN